MRIRITLLRAVLVSAAVLVLIAGVVGLATWLARPAPVPVAMLEDPTGSGGFSTLLFPYYADPVVNEANFVRLAEQYRLRKLTIAATYARQYAQNYLKELQWVKARGRELGPREVKRLAGEFEKMMRKTDVWSEDNAEWAYQQVPLAHPASAASAAALLKLRERKVDHPTCVLSRLIVYPEALDPAWQAYLEAVADQMEGTSSSMMANVLLCRMGVAARREALLEKARKDLANAHEVEALLFRRSAETGAMECLVMPENTELARALAERSKHAGARVKSAKYLAKLGERELAEVACLEVLRQRYTPVDVPPERAEIDYAVAFAKQEALELLYYEIQTEEGLRALYEMAQETDRRHQKLMNSSATQDIDEKYGSPGQTDLDARRAQSLISELMVP